MKFVVAFSLKYATFNGGLIFSFFFFIFFGKVVGGKTVVVGGMHSF